MNFAEVNEDVEYEEYDDEYYGDYDDDNVEDEYIDDLDDEEDLIDDEYEYADVPFIERHRKLFIKVAVGLMLAGLVALATVIVLSIVSRSSSSTQNRAKADSAAVEIIKDADAEETVPVTSEKTAVEPESEEDKLKREGFVIDPRGFAIREPSIDNRAPNVTLKGSFANTSGKKLTSVSLGYWLYSESNEPLGIASAGVTDLDPGEVWEFEATCPDVLTDDMFRFERVDMQVVDDTGKDIISGNVIDDNAADADVAVDSGESEDVEA